MTDLLAALLLGIIEGITEFLPISSTGHLLIAEHWLGARSDLFNISIQAGAILAVVLIYWQRLLALTLGLRERAKRDYALKLAVAFGVTAVLGLGVKKLGFELPETLGPIAWALLLGGFVMLGAEAIDARRPDLPDDDPDAIGWGTAVLVGFAQVLAGVFPGTSRSAAAIFAALLFGRSSRVAATEFAFLVGIPTMFAATGYELLHTLKDGGSAGEDWSALGVAFVVSALTAFAAVKWLLRYIQTHRFTVFAWYRIVLGAALLGWLYFGAAAPAVAAGTSRASGAGAAGFASAVAGNREALETLRAQFPSSAPHPKNIDVSDTRAARPSGDPASAALQREFGIRKFCTETMYVGHNLDSTEVGEVLEGVSAPDYPAELRQEFLANWNKSIADFEEAERACSGWHDKLMDGSSYGLALRAAELGDPEAAACFVSGSFPMPPVMHQDPKVLARFRLDAAHLIERGIARGDWNMVHAASLAYATGPAGRPAPKFEPPTYSPGLLILLTVGPPGGNAEMAYKMARLMQLGAADAESAEWFRKAAERVAPKLTPVQRQAAATWARTAFGRQFQRRRMRAEDSTYCE